MKIFVEAKTNVKKEYIEQFEDTHFRVGVKVVPEKGKANERIIKMLAESFDVAPSRIILCSGSSSKRKVFEIS
ncbi:MAG: DUF167 domain-containing protein [Candidatus Moraniibacteriota bacterium]|nr:MAG: DUF167 domain-containing protein [Candidatus Moranbacteria bacterium]